MKNKEKKHIIDIDYETLINNKKDNVVIFDDFIDVEDSSDFLIVTDGISNKNWLQGKDFKILVKEIWNDNGLLEYGALLYNKVAKQLDLESLDYKVGIFRDRKVLFSKNFIEKGEVFLTGKELISSAYPKEIYSFRGAELVNDITYYKYNCLEKIPEILYEANKNINKNDINKINSQVFKMHVCDLLVNFNDRHPDNWGIKLTKNNRAKLAPIYDNEWSFMLNNEIDFIESYVKGEEDIISSSIMDFRFLFDKSKYSKDQSQELINYIEKWKAEEVKVLYKVIEKLSIEKAIEEVEMEIGREINKLAKMSALKTFNTIKESMLESMKILINSKNLNIEKTR